MAISTTEIVSDVKPILGTNYSIEAHSDTLIKGYINKAIRKVDKSGDWSFNVKEYTLTTDGVTTSYTVPFQKQTLEVLLWDEPVEYVTLEEYYASTDRSNLMAIDAETVITTMAGTFKITYRGNTDRITTIASGSVALPDAFYELLTSATLYYGFKHAKDYDKVRQYEQEIKDEVESLRRYFGDQKPNKTIRLSSKEKNYVFA